MSSDQTRRDVIKQAPAPLIFGLGDGDDGLFGGIFGGSDTPSPAVAVGHEGSREQVDSREVSLYIAYSGQLFEPDGFGGWDEVLYKPSQIADFDPSALLEGQKSARPSAGESGRWFHATDEDILYRDDGSQWNAIAGTGTSSTRVPAMHVDKLNGADIASASSGEVPKAQGDGTFSMGTVGSNVPGWTKDGTASASDESDLSYSLSSSYDIVKVIAHDIRGSGSSNESLDLTVDGDTGSNYINVDGDATRDGGLSAFGLLDETPPGDASIFGELWFSGKFTNLFQMENNLAKAEDPKAAEYGINNNISSPLDSFKIQWSSSNIWGKVAVFGLDV